MAWYLAARFRRGKGNPTNTQTPPASQSGKLYVFMQFRSATGPSRATAYLIAAALFLIQGAWVARRLFPAPPAAPIAVSFAGPPTGPARPPLLVDLNHDNRLDTVTLNTDQDGRQTISIRLDGMGSRILHCPYQGHSGSVVNAADVDGDANLDLLRISENSLEAAVVWLGDGKGNFVLSKASTSFPTDFHTVPPPPYRSSSTPGSPAISWIARTAAEKRTRARPLKAGASGHRGAVKQHLRFRFQPGPSVRIQSELLACIARRINAPPPPSLFV